MTKKQIIEEFHQMNVKTKASLLRELLENGISDEMREDVSDYLIAIQAKKEGGYIPFDEYHNKRIARIRKKKNS